MCITYIYIYINLYRMRYKRILFISKHKSYRIQRKFFHLVYMYDTHWYLYTNIYLYICVISYNTTFLVIIIVFL